MVKDLLYGERRKRKSLSAHETFETMYNKTLLGNFPDLKNRLDGSIGSRELHKRQSIDYRNHQWRSFIGRFNRYRLVCHIWMENGCYYIDGSWENVESNKVLVSGMWGVFLWYINTWGSASSLNFSIFNMGIVGKVRCNK